MMLSTCADVQVDALHLSRYFQSLINHIFKILPIWESGEKTLPVYMKSLQSEILGCRSLIDAVRQDPMLLSLASILQHLIDHPECEVCDVRREVFRAISILCKLRDRYSAEDDEERKEDPS